MELQPGKLYQVKTRSIHPPIFEIPDFLTDSECKHMIYQATRLGLEASYIRDLKENIVIEPTNEDTFNGWDHNRDSGISVQEVLYKLQELSFLYFMEEDIETMFVDLAIDQNGNGVMDLDEFLPVTTGRIMRYLHKLASNNPRTLIRNSRQTWLEYSTVNGLAARVAALTKLPVNVIEGSEKVQVVNYGSRGHYYCHHDSEEISDNLPCCLENDKRKCILCRYITVLYFLNDVEEGGETAFPVADNATFSEEAWANTFKDTCDFSKSCHQANLYIKPTKGTAVMWYNHVRNDSTGWVGDLDHRSYHGGCDVIKGHKWIANNWINIIGQSRDTMILYHTSKEKSING